MQTLLGVATLPAKPTGACDMKYYFYVRPDRNNWQPTVEKCRRQLLKELLGGKTVKQAESTMHCRFQNVSNTYWDEFWNDVTDIPVERAYG
jgi:hypothetical protein